MASTATITGNYTEVVLHGRIVFSSKEVSDIFASRAMEAHPEMFDHPAISEGQTGWEVKRDLKVFQDTETGEIILAVHNTWTWARNPK